jgi:CHASE3 domain sensor protein
LPDLDITNLIRELAGRYGIRLDTSDPAITIVVLNRIVLEKSSEELTESVARRLAQFEASVQSVERRAGKMLAKQLAEVAARMRAELQNDIDAASLKAAHLVYLVDRAHKRPVIIRWLATGLLLAVALLGLGSFAGMCLR